MLVEYAMQNLTGVEVVRVFPRTAAESCGLLVGDLLLTINGIDISSRERVNKLFNSIKIGQTLNLEWFGKANFANCPRRSRDLLPAAAMTVGVVGPLATVVLGFEP